MLKWLRKQPTESKPQEPQLTEFLKTYDRHQIAAALTALEGNNLAFQVFKAWAQQKAAYHASQCLNLAAMQGGQTQAAYASGAEAGIRELITKDLPRYIEFLRGNTGVYTPTPEEE